MRPVSDIFTPQENQVQIRSSLVDICLIFIPSFLPIVQNTVVYVSFLSCMQLGNQNPRDRDSGKYKHKRLNVAPFCTVHGTIQFICLLVTRSEMEVNLQYRSGTVNSKSFVGKVLLRIKWKFKLN